MKRLAVAALVVVLALPASALAVRPATDDEAAAVANRPDLNSDCFRVTVSTVDPTWSLIRTTGLGEEECPGAGDGLAVSHLEKGVWKQVLSDSNETSNLCSFYPEVPSKVGVDLGLCVPPVDRSKTTITCWKPTKKVGKEYVTPRRVVRRPRSCSTLAPLESFASARDLHAIRWSSWGGTTAKGKGTAWEWHLDQQRRVVKTRVAITLYAPVEVGGRRWYSKMKLTSRNGTGRYNLAEPYTDESPAT